MSIGILYATQNLTHGEEIEFTPLPFNNANINHNRDKASEMSFKSQTKLQEGDRIIYKNNDRTFGGQIIKRDKSFGDIYKYDVIDYTRLYHSKVTCSFSKKTSSQIIKTLLKQDQNGLSTAGISSTSYVHKYLKWDKTSLWDIISQLAWLEYQAGNYIYYDVDFKGNLIWKPIPEKIMGYAFTSAYDYSESYDSSDIITRGVLLDTDTGDVNTVQAGSDIIARWGVISEVETCSKTTSNSKNTSCTNTKTSNKYWGQCGLSPDKKLVCAIGKPSAPGENKYGYQLYKTVFTNKCPHCGKSTLIWAYQWGNGLVPCKGTHEGGSAEGHIFCTNCDADYGCLNGHEHVKGSSYKLKIVSKPVKSSQKEANLLKKAKLPYNESTVKNSKTCKKSNVESKSSLKNEANINKYNIPSSVWKQALEITNPKNSTMQNAKSIFNYVKQNIKMESYSNTRYGADGTLKKRKGNCTDHAHLMCGLLRSIGIKCNYIHNSCIHHVYNKVYIDGKGVIVDTGRQNPSWGSHWGGAGCPTEKTTLNF